MQAHLLFLSSPPPGASQTEHSRSTTHPAPGEGPRRGGLDWTPLKKETERTQRKRSDWVHCGIVPAKVPEDDLHAHKRERERERERKGKGVIGFGVVWYGAKKKKKTHTRKKEREREREREREERR